MTKRILFLIIALQLLISSTAAAIACNDGGVIDIPVDCSYDYPKPGMPEWDTAKSGEERYKVCEIPEHILLCISTEKLARLVTLYPGLWVHIGGYNSFTDNNGYGGLDRIFANFNGIRELSKRENALIYLCDEYLLELQKFEYDIDNRWNSVIQLQAIECLIGYYKLHNNISKDNLKKILKNLWIGYNEKIKYSDYFKGMFAGNLFARANIIIKIAPTLSEIFEVNNKSVLYRGIATADMINTMDSLTTELIK